MTGSKVKISQAEYIQRANVIIENRKIPDDLKMMSLLELANKFDIATETDMFNELLHPKKG
ncbi:MAG: hypothetical protein ACREGC_01275 [Minisyncoccia bacterium]